MDTSVTRMDMRMKTQNAIEDSQKNDSLFRLASVASLACLVWAMLMSGNLVSAADSVICVQNSIAMEQLNWNYNLSVPAFDSTLGQLNSVTLTLTATLSGSVYVENESANPVDFTALLNAEVDLGDTNTSPAVLQAKPFITIDQPLDAFDGNEDFGGTSGAVIEGLTNIQVVATTFTNAADLAAFAAGFAYPVAAYGDSSYVGGGTMVTIFLSSAQADLNVCYSYTPVAQGAGLLAAHLTATPLCSGQSCNLTVTAVNGAGGPYRAVWTGPNSLNTTTTNANPSQSLTVSAAGTYIVTVTDLLSGLAAKATNVVTSFPAPSCTITAGPAPAPGSAANFLGVDAGTNAVRYLWSIASSTGPGWLLDQTTVNSQYVVYTAGSSGTATFQVLVTTAAGCSGTCTTAPIGLSLPLSLSCVSATTGQIGLPYASSLAASGGTPAYTYSISSGSLPAGLTLNPTTGAITGTPTTAGTFTFTATVTDSTSSRALAATANCTITIQACSASICGTIMRDCNGDRVGDQGLANVVAALKNSQGATVATTKTDANGAYCFNGLSAGNYVVSVTPPNGVGKPLCSIVRRWTDWNRNQCWNDSDGNQHWKDRNGCHHWTDTSGQHHWQANGNQYCDLGWGKTCLEDCNGSGVNVDDSQGKTTWNDSTGCKHWRDLAGNDCWKAADGNIHRKDSSGNECWKDSSSKCNWVDTNNKFHCRDQAGHRYCLDSQGRTCADPVDPKQDDCSCSDGNDNEKAITLATCQNKTGVNFAYVGLGSICGFVLRDCNGDRVGDQGLAGVSVTLENSSGSALATTKTDANGAYCFTGLSAGNYAVSVVPPGGVAKSLCSIVKRWNDRNGNSCWNDSDGNQHWNDQNGCHNWIDTDGKQHWQTSDGKQYCNDGAGKIRLEDCNPTGVGVDDSSGKTCWNDSTGTKHWKDSDGNDCWKAGDGCIHRRDGSGNERWVGSTGTCNWIDSNAKLHWKNREGNRYCLDTKGRVCPDPVAPADDDCRRSDGSDNEKAVVLAGCQDKSDLDFTFAGAANVCGFVLLDKNGDGTGDQALSRVAVAIQDSTGATVATTTTDSTGAYCFYNLPAATYTVVVTPPSSCQSWYHVDKRWLDTKGNHCWSDTKGCSHWADQTGCHNWVDTTGKQHWKTTDGKQYCNDGGGKIRLEYCPRTGVAVDDSKGKTCWYASGTKHWKDQNGSDCWKAADGCIHRRDVSGNECWVDASSNCHWLDCNNKLHWIDADGNRFCQDSHGNACAEPVASNDDDCGNSDGQDSQKIVVVSACQNKAGVNFTYQQTSSYSGYNQWGSSQWGNYQW